MARAPLIQLSDISLTFGGHPIFSDLGFVVQTGDRLSLVGRNGSGKSTLMNVISKSEVFAENKLFATVDSTVRKIVYNNIPFLLTDTVGFIRITKKHYICI